MILEKSSKKIAFFDVDHTVLDANSGYITSIDLIKNKIMKKRRLAQALYYKSASKIFDQDVAKIYQFAIADLVGMTRDEIFKRGEKIFYDQLLPYLFQEAVDIILEHQANGDRVVILSSGPYMTLWALEKYLNFDAAYCMSPQIADNILSNKLIDPICYGPGKLHYALQDIKEQGSRLEDCYFYTDHHSDIFLLEKVGHPRVVNPTRKLRREALRRGWQILKFKERVGRS